MKVRAIETTTGDVLTRQDTDAMGLPFETGWACWGIFDSRGECLDTFPTYAQAQDFRQEFLHPLPLAA